MSKFIENSVAFGLSAGLLAGCGGGERGGKVEGCRDGFSTDIETTYDEVAELEVLSDDLMYGEKVLDPTNEGWGAGSDYVNVTGEIACTKDEKLFLTMGGLLLREAIENAENI